MLTHYLRRSWVSALRHKQYTALNLVGLAIGIASFLLIALFVQHEFNYDRFAGAERIYRLGMYITSADAALYSAKLPPGYAPLIQAQVPGVARIVRFYQAPEPMLRTSIADRHTNQEKVLYGDPAAVGLFKLPVVRGDLARFDGPAAAILTTSTAERYFGATDPIGKTITLEGKTDVDVVAVVDDRNGQTHMDFEMLLSIGALASTLGPDAIENTTNHRSYTYLQIDDPARVPAIEQSIDKLFTRFSEPGETYAAHLIAVRDIHVHSPDPSDEMKYGASASRLYTFCWSAFSS